MTGLLLFLMALYRESCNG